MNIFHLVSSLDYGGVERTVVDLSIALKCRGHSIVVCALKDSGRLAETLSTGGIPFFALNKADGFQFGTVRRLAVGDALDVIEQRAPTAVPVVHSDVKVENVDFPSLGSG